MNLTQKDFDILQDVCTISSYKSVINEKGVLFTTYDLHENYRQPKRHNKYKGSIMNVLND